ncbi:MAG: hypothetical protein E7324_04940 [Clostridiales bacterium]|nr:hypothetical protein [Clostridiales bacterium]
MPFGRGYDPNYGPLPDPVPGVYNGCWVPGPGASIQDDPEGFADCRRTLPPLIGKYRQDERILLWDLYNEPGNGGRGEKCLPLLKAAFSWAREMDPIQPLTASLWKFSDDMARLNEAQFALSDAICFHIHASLGMTANPVEQFGRPNRP